jgi:hypothetical protein
MIIGLLLWGLICIKMYYTFKTSAKEVILDNKNTVEEKVEFSILLGVIITLTVLSPIILFLE